MSLANNKSLDAMNPSLDILPPAWSQIGAVIVFGSAAILVALHSTMLALAGGRTTLRRETQIKAPIMAALLLGLWLGWAAIVAQHRALAGPSPNAG